MFRKIPQRASTSLNFFQSREKSFQYFSKNTFNPYFSTPSTGSPFISRAYSHVIYVTGSNLNGCLGLNSKAKESEPTQIPSKFFKQSNDIVKINAYGSGTHVGAINDEGHLFMWGKNKYGQLGTGDQNSKFAPVRNDFFIQQGLTVKDVSCGERHTLATTQDDRLFSFGYGASSILGISSLFGIQLKNDALGYPSHGNQLIPKEIESLRGKNIISMSCGDYHSGVVTKEGEIYVWGRGDWGRLGNGSNKSFQIPHLLQSENFKEHNNFKKIACGDAFTIALSTSGAVFTWGRNENSQLGIGENGVGYITGGSQFDCEKTPQFLDNNKFFDGKKVIDIDCGPVTGAAVDEDDQFYYWGRILPSPIHIHQVGKVEDFSIGKRHGLVLSKDGRVFMIGSYTAMGNKQHIEDITSKIKTPGRIVKVIAGHDYSIFLCEE